MTEDPHGETDDHQGGADGAEDLRVGAEDYHRKQMSTTEDQVELTKRAQRG